MKIVARFLPPWALLLAMVSFLCVAEADKVLTAAIRGTASNTGIFGLAQIVESSSDGSVRITAKVQGLPDGPHGFHIHTYGDIVGKDDGTAAGGHYNPNGNNHAGPSNPLRHVGDLGNIVSSSGSAVYDETFLVNNTARPTVDRDFSNSVIGRSFVIHANADDLVSQPTGDAGGRLAAGVIGIGNQDLVGDFLASEDFEKPSALVCRIYGQGDVDGSVKIILNGAGVAEVTARMSGLSEGLHGFHVHTYGEEYNFETTNVSNPVRDLTRTGGHWNPSNVAHGLPSAATRHAGDMGNLQIGADGMGQLSLTLPGVTDLRSLVGRTCLVHQDEDDGTDPAGNAGPRIAAGQLGFANPDTQVVLVTASTAAATTAAAAAPTTVAAGVDATTPAPTTFKVVATMTLLGMTEDDWTGSAETAFINAVATLFGKAAGDVTVTGYSAARRRLTRRLMQSAGLKVDYEVAGFESVAAATAAQTDAQGKVADLVTALQADAAFQDKLTDIDFPVIADATDAAPASTMVSWTLVLACISMALAKY